MIVLSPQKGGDVVLLDIQKKDIVVLRLKIMFCQIIISLTCCSFVND